MRRALALSFLLFVLPGCTMFSKEALQANAVRYKVTLALVGSVHGMPVAAPPQSAEFTLPYGTLITGVAGPMLEPLIVKFLKVRDVKSCKVTPKEDFAITGAVTASVTVDCPKESASGSGTLTFVPVTTPPPPPAATSIEPASRTVLSQLLD